MLPQSVLLYSDYPSSPFRFQDRILTYRRVPHLFHERDQPWLARYRDEFMSFKGKKRRDLLEHFKGPLSFDFPRKKGELIFHLLQRMTNEDKPPRAGALARKIRAAVFQLSAAQSSKPDIQKILETVGTPHGLPASTVLEYAFADLPLEQKLDHFPEKIETSTLLLQANLALLQGLISRSQFVEVSASGEIRRIVRQVKLKRLICEVKTGRLKNGRPTSMLCISGPLSIFGHTTMYGRALAEIIPLLCWCDHFTLSAVCRVRGKDALVEMKSSDLVLPSAEPKKYDSQVEARFAKEFKAAAPDWNLIREPESFQVKGTDALIFPDFKIEHRHNPQIHFYLEIMGFWTPEYLTRKMEQLEKAGIRNLILCVDEALGCGDPNVPEKLRSLGHVIRYQKKIDVEKVFNIMTLQKNTH